MFAIFSIIFVLEVVLNKCYNCLLNFHEIFLEFREFCENKIENIKIHPYFDSYRYLLIFWYFGPRRDQNESWNILTKKSAARNADRPRLLLEEGHHLREHALHGAGLGLHDALDVRRVHHVPELLQNWKVSRLSVDKKDAWKTIVDRRPEIFWRYVTHTWKSIH